MIDAWSIIDRKHSAAPPALACLACGSTHGVEMECSRTAYHWDGVGRDPNAPIPLCRKDAIEHHANWDGMWAEYYAGRL